VIAQMPTSERPRERLLRAGGRALADAELVAVLLRTGTPGRSALDLATELLCERGGLPGLAECSYQEIERRGLGKAKAATLLAGLELGRRLARSSLPERLAVGRVEEVVGYLSMRYGVKDQEVVGALYLDARRRLLAERELSRGTLRSAAVEPRAVLRQGLLEGAAAVLLFHTHPSGDIVPSSSDWLLTRRLVAAGQAVGIELLDHLVLGRAGRWTSMRSQGSW
jgi:DNA repair protein RadC